MGLGASFDVWLIFGPIPPKFKLFASITLLIDKFSNMIHSFS